MAMISEVIKQEGNVLQEPAAAMHLMFIWGCSKFMLSTAPLFQPKLVIIWPFSHNYHQLLKVPL